PLRLLLAAIIFSVVDPCLRTQPGGVDPNACDECVFAEVVITQDGNGAKPMTNYFWSENPDGCATLTFDCVGLNANIEVNYGQGVVTQPPNAARFTIT
ncbi:hypothetical protein PMAYCL1PPCAC_19732, partial [Pristionchus mayeri]